MHDPFGVRRFEGIRDLANGFGRLFGREFPPLGQRRAEVLSLDVFHGDELDAFGLAQVKNPDDVLVGNLARQDQFLLEALEDFRVACELRPDDFQHHQPVHFAVSGLVDRAHSSHTQQPKNFVSRPKHASRLQDRERRRGRFRHPDRHRCGAALRHAVERLGLVGAERGVALDAGSRPRRITRIAIGAIHGLCRLCQPVHACAQARGMVEVIERRNLISKEPAMARRAYPRMPYGALHSAPMSRQTSKAERGWARSRSRQRAPSSWTRTMTWPHRG